MTDTSWQLLSSTALGNPNCWSVFRLNSDRDGFVLTSFPHDSALEMEVGLGPPE